MKYSIANVKTTLAVEGLKMNRRTVIYGRKYLKGEVTSKDVIDNITKYLVAKNRKLNNSIK